MPIQPLPPGHAAAPAAQSPTWRGWAGDTLEAFARHMDPRYDAARERARRQAIEDEDRARRRAIDDENLAFSREERARRRGEWRTEDSQRAIGQIFVEEWNRAYGGAPPEDDRGTPGVSRAFPVAPPGSPPTPRTDDGLGALETGAPEPAIARDGLTAPQPPQAPSPRRSEREILAIAMRRMREELPPEDHHLIAPTIARIGQLQEAGFTKAMTLLTRGDIPGAKRAFREAGNDRVTEIAPGDRPGTFKITMGGKTEQITAENELIAMSQDPLPAMRQQEDARQRGEVAQARAELYRAQAQATRERAARPAPGTPAQAPPQALKAPDIENTHEEVIEAMLMTGVASRDHHGKPVYPTPEVARIADTAKALARRGLQLGRPLSGEMAVTIARDGQLTTGVRVSEGGALVSTQRIMHGGRTYEFDGAPERRANMEDLLTYIKDVGVDKLEDRRFVQQIIPAAQRAGIFSVRESPERVIEILKGLLQERLPATLDPHDARARGQAGAPVGTVRQRATGPLTEAEWERTLPARP